MKLTFQKATMSSPGLYWYFTIFSIDLYKTKYEESYIKSIVVILFNYRIAIEW